MLIQMLEFSNRYERIKHNEAIGIGLYTMLVRVIQIFLNNYLKYLERIHVMITNLRSDFRVLVRGSQTIRHKGPHLVLLSPKYCF
jgi:hypothetical protein